MRIDHKLAGDIPAPTVQQMLVDCNGHDIFLGDMCRLSDSKIEQLLIQNDNSTDPFSPVTKGWETSFLRKMDRDGIQIKLKVMFKIVGYQGENYIIMHDNAGVAEIGYVTRNEIQFVYRPVELK